MPNSFVDALSLRTIAGRLLFWFLVIALVPCGILTALTSWISARTLEDSVRRALVVASEAKANELETYALERLHDVTALARVPTVIEAAAQLDEALGEGGAGASGFKLLQAQYRPFLTYITDAFEYPNVFLFSSDGDVLFRAREGLDPGGAIEAGPLRGTELAAAVDRARTLLQAELSDFQAYPGIAEPAAFIASPVLDQGGAVVGVIAFQLNNAEIFKVFNDYTGLGETGETLVGIRDGDEVRFVAPLRHEAAVGVSRTIEMGGPDALPLQRAVQGERGFGREVDYRGVPVVAVWTYLPSFRWGMVVKQDADEALALIAHQRLAIGGVLLAVLAAVAVVARVVARQLSRPIREAASVAERVASGDLTARVEATATGETGQLLGAIQTMTDYLRSLIGRIQRSSVTLMSTATEIAATSRQQDRVVNDYGASTNQAVAAVRQISSTSQELLRTMNDVYSVASHTAEMASSGQESLGGMDRTMRQLAESTGSIGSKLSVISERAGNINMVVTTITRVADQTNLLSINAAIEAEKAGEYGLGFLVVAREIRRLADQTAVATLDIERMVKEMQYSVSAGVMEMDKFSEQVRQGVDEVGHVSGQLGQIIQAVQALTGRFEEVNEGMRAQSQGADQIREAMVRLSEGANQTALSLREFNRANEHLRDAVGGLKEEVSRFTLGPAESDPIGEPAASTPRAV